VLGQGVCTTAQNCVLDADGDASVLSAMANVILDFGDENGITDSSAWCGYGSGRYRHRLLGHVPNTPVTGFGVDDDDTALAGQIIAGLRMPVSENMDAGLKYRYFNTQKLKFSDGTDHLEGHWRSHSLLVSLTYNFYSPAASAAAPAASAASRDADVPGRIGDPGDRRLPGSAASASAAAAGARARLSERAQENSRSGATRAGFFYAFEFRSASRATGTAGRAAGSGIIAPRRRG
jgi:hypothetical protein